MTKLPNRVAPSKPSSLGAIKNKKMKKKKEKKLNPEPRISYAFLRTQDSPLTVISMSSILKCKPMAFYFAV